MTKSEAFLSGFQVVPISDEAAELFEQLRSVKKYKKIKPGDLLIAAITLACQATLVTRSLKDFQLIPNLPVENWAD